MAGARAEIRDGRIVVVEGSENLVREGYGSEIGGELVLDAVEAAYLVYTGRMEVVEKGEKLDFQALASRASSQDDMFWVTFTVYYDLRKRGRKVSRGVWPHSLIFKGPDGLVEVYVLEESRALSMQSIVEMMESSVRNDRIPVLAIVDRHGDVTYYSVNRFTPAKR